MAGFARQGRQVPRDDGVAATRLVLAVSAAAYAQATPYANAPLLAKQTAPRVELFARAQRLGWDSWGWGYEGAAS